MYASRITQFIVGVFGLVGIAALCVLAFTLGKIPLLEKPYYTLYAMFDNVSGLKPNDAVQIAGVKVGKVATIALSQKNERARVALQIDDGVNVDDETIASIKTSGIIGDKYVSLSIGGGDPLKPGGTIVQTESSFVLEDAIAQLMGNSGGKSGNSSGDSSQNNSSTAPASNQKPAGGGAIAPPPGANASNGPNKASAIKK